MQIIWPYKKGRGVRAARRRMEGREELLRAAPPETAPAVAPVGRERPYRGVRMRKWGKWVAEIREPNKRSRIWLGSYSTPVAAARAYDTAVYLLRGNSARLNFPEELEAEEATSGLPAADASSVSAATIRKKATEVGTRVDALQAALLSRQQQNQTPPPPTPPPARSSKHPDLNEQPSPEISDEE